MIYTKEQILQAEELRKERKEARQERENISIAKHSASGSKKAGLTRKLNRVHARILELNTALSDAPPSPLETGEAIAWIGDIVQLLQDTYDEAKARFMEHCADDPDSAVKYCLKNMMIAGAKADFFRYIHKVLQSDPCLGELKEGVESTRECVMNEHILNVLSISSSRESNLVDEYKHEAAIQLIQKRMAFTNVFDRMDDIFVGVEVWRILNGLQVNKK